MNIIKDNRIVNDHTFATRFVNFLQNIQVNDASSYDELNYLKTIAEYLLKHQINTCTDENESEYLKMNHKNIFKK